MPGVIRSIQRSVISPTVRPVVRVSLGPDLIIGAAAANWYTAGMGTNTIVDDGDLDADEVLITFGNTNFNPELRFSTDQGAVATNLTDEALYLIGFTAMQVSGDTLFLRAAPGNIDTTLTGSFVRYEVTIVADDTAGFSNKLFPAAFNAGDALRVKGITLNRIL